ncbi:MAG TPA: amino acid adenylation domain-containing protein [Thermoanaerobaculia bacterium]|nr:amino acid adenylation domain-containing protein [Thermoanaerobaculia bacterium]
MTDLAARLAGLSPKKRELLLRQLARKQGEPAPERIPRRERTTDRFPLSFSQLREWILVQLEPHTPAYNIPGGARVHGPLDPAVFARSIREIVRRHEALRTTFAETGGEPVQVIAPPGEFPVPRIDLAALPPEAREAEAARLTAFEQALPFDLARGPLLRVALVRLAPEDHLALFTMHHIISDGWSLGVFRRELGALYAAFSRGLPSPLPPLPLQYADFAAWQRERLHGEALDAQIVWWRGELAGSPPLLPLPTDRPRPPVQTNRGAALSFSLPPGLVPSLRAAAQAQGASLFMALLAGFAALLSRWSGEDDVPVGTYTGNRARSELEGLIGFFINTLVLRTRLDDGPAFRPLLARVREVTLGAFAHQDLPFEGLLEALHPERDLSHTPLFQHLLVLQNFPTEAEQMADVRLSPLALENDHASFDVSLYLEEAGDRVTGAAQYNVDLFDAATIARLTRHLGALLEAAVREPDRPVHELPLLSPEENDQLLGDWSGAATAAPSADAPVHALFEIQAERSPESVAVEAGDRRMTYAELNDRANRLARHLAKLEVGTDVLVGLAAERSPEALVGMLGIWKAGGAYLPLDPAYPEDRRAFMVEDSGARLVLTQQNLEGGDWETESPAPLGIETPPESAAYLIYTSGSTGRPKGVVVPHRAIARYTADAAAVYGTGRGERVLQFAALSFDTSAEEIWPALATGATLVLRPEGMLDSVPRFLAEVDRLGITLLNLPTAYWHEVAAGAEGAALPKLRRIVIGGEKALPEPLAAWRRTGHSARVINTYGPTETTIVATRHELEADGEIPIGRPISGARVFVVDRAFQPAPPGAAGELLIGGAGLSRGYLGRPDLTAAAFVPDPFTGEPGARLYHSGDLVRFRSGGVLEFLGRVDAQVKVRGFRIEPGEIESVLGTHPALRAAAVAADDARLIAWIVAEGPEPPTTTELRRFLADRLPEHMIPAVFVPLESFPLTPSGKVDRRALPRPEGDRPRLEREYVPPASEVEEALAAIWAEALGVPRVGVQDNFFELGGHSLLATQVVARIREHLQVDLPLIALFQMPTVEQLAMAVEEAILDKLEALEDAEVQALL